MTDRHEHDPQQEHQQHYAEQPADVGADADAAADHHAPDAHTPASTTGAGEGAEAVEDNGDGQGQAGDNAAAIGELVWVDPRELIIGKNVRLDPRLDRYFISSIRDRGVREPIIARRRAEDGALVVRKGKRRTLAAIEVNRKWVRVLAEPDGDPAEDDTSGQIDRVVDQIEENDQRAGNTDAEHVAAVQELLDLGLSPTAIARRTHRPRPTVKAAAKVAGSELVTAAMSHYDNLTLDRAAVVAEFDDGTDDAAEAVKALIVTAQSQPGQFEHVAQRMRDEKDQRRRVAERVAELSATGARVVTERDNVATSRISGLRPTAADPSGTELTEEAHRECPGHTALITIRPGWRDRPDEVITSWVCTDAETHGHTGRWDRLPASGTRGLTGARVPGPMSEQEKVARRATIENNKAWESATKVRVKWLRETLLARKNAPKNANQFIAATLARGGHHLRRAMESGHPTACALLGMRPAPGYGATSPITEATETATPARATMLTLAVLLGAAEQATSKASWRAPIDTDTRAYFAMLQDWGYELSPVEQLVLTPDTSAGPGDAAQPGDAATADATTSGENALAHAGETDPHEHHDGDRHVDPTPAHEHEDQAHTDGNPEADAPHSLRAGDQRTEKPTAA